MLLECLIKRVGPTVVTLENTKYDFMPIPGTKYRDVKHRNLVTVINAAGQQVKEWVEEIRSEPAEESTSVCDVGKEQHVSHLLASGQYRPYNQDRAIKEADERRKKNAINLFEGYKFEKYFDLGYIIVKKDSTYPYVGSDGVWRKEHSGSYFKTEIEAYGFLTEEIEVARERKSKAK